MLETVATVEPSPLPKESLSSYGDCNNLNTKKNKEGEDWQNVVSTQWDPAKYRNTTQLIDPPKSPTETPPNSIGSPSSPISAKMMIGSKF